MHAFPRLLLILFLLLSLFSRGQVSPELLPVRSGGKMGYIDPTGKIVLPLKYDAAGPFSAERLAIAGIDRRYMLITLDGKEVQGSTFDFLEHLDGKFYAVQQDTAWGILRADSGMVLRPVADQPPIVSDMSFLYIVEGRWGLLSRHGRMLLETEHDTIISLGAGCWKYRKGKEKGVFLIGKGVVLKGKFDSVFVISLKNENILCGSSGKSMRFYFTDPGKADTGSVRKWRTARGGEYLFLEHDTGATAYISAKGSLLFRKDAERMEEFMPGLILISAREKYGLMDHDGKDVLATEYDEIIRAADGRIWVLRNGTWGLSDGMGKILQPCRFDEVTSFKHNLAAVREGKKWGLVNIAGDLVVPLAYREVVIDAGKARLYTFSNVTEVAKTDRWGNVLDRTDFGNLKTLRIYKPSSGPDSLLNLTGTNGNRNNDSAMYRYGWFFNSTLRKWGMKDSSGKTIIPPVFHGIEFHEAIGLTLVYIKIPKKDFYVCGREVERRRKYGLVDHVNKRVILGTQFLDIFIEDFYSSPDAAARVMDDEGHFYMKSRLGVTMFGCSYIDDFYDGLARVNKGGMMKKRCDTCPEGFRGTWIAPGSDPTRPETHAYFDGSYYITGGLWGYVNLRGQLVIPLKFQFTNRFRLGQANFKMKNKWGVVDTAGSFIVKPEYDGIERFSAPRLPGSPDSILYRLKRNLNRCAFVDRMGVYVTDLKYQQCRDFREGYAAVQYRHKWGFVDTTGREITEIIYDRVEDFYNGFAAVKKKGKWGFLERDGRIAVETKYQDVGRFSDGAAWFMMNGKYGFVDEAGNEIIPAKFQDAGEFYQDLAPVQWENRWGYIDRTGKLVIPPKYNSASSFGAYDIALVRTDAGYGAVNTKGKEVLPLVYQFIGEVKDGILRIRKDNLYGYADNLGNVVISPQFKDAQDFSEGLAAVTNGDGWYYVTPSGERLNTAVYSYCKPFTNGSGISLQSGRYSFTDINGNVQALPPGWNPQPFSEDGFSVVSVRKKGKAWVTRSGNLGVKKYYRAIKTFYDGAAPARLKTKWGILDKAGYCITGFKFDDVGEFSYGLLRVKIFSFYGITNGRGKELVPADFEIITLPFEGAPFLYLEHKGDISYMKRDGTWLWKPQ